MFDHPDFDGHEAVHMFSDPQSGLRALIGLHSTHLGPGGGGTRLWHYNNSADAITDVLRLSRGMSYKNAMAGLNLGGGKAVIMRPPGDFDRVALFAALGRAIDSLGGKYITAEDVGVSPDDMRVVAQHTKYVGGLDEGEFASGDPSPVTADGVFRCIARAAQHRFGSDLRGVRVTVQGLGHVGYDLCERLTQAGAKLIVSDINRRAVQKAEAELGARIVGLDEIYDVDADIYAPCALGATVNEDTINRLKCAIIAGAANNQLRVPSLGADLKERGILYCPDYIVNAGGIINVAAEIEGFYEKAWVDAKLDGIEETLQTIIDTAERDNRPTNQVANEMARARIGR